MTHGKIELGDVLNFFEYEKVREEMRGRVIALKRTRRVAVGPYLSFVLEYRDTLLFQIQEMCRVERITDDAKIQDYNYRAVKESIARAVAGKPTAAEVTAQRNSAHHPFAAKA